MRSIRRFPLVGLFLMLVVLAAPAPRASAQEQAETKILTIDDFARWRSIPSAQLSDDGTWVAFAYARGTPSADDTLYVQPLGRDEPRYEIPRGSRPRFSDDSRWVAYFVVLPWEESEKLREERKPVPQKGELLELATGTRYSWDHVASLEFARGGRHLAVKKTKANREAKHEGTDLILRHLREGFEELIGSVSASSFNKPGTLLAYAVDAADRDGNGLYLIHLENGSRRVLDNDRLEYARLTWEEEGRALAALKGEKPEKKVQKENVLITVRRLDRRQPDQQLYDPADDPTFPEGFVISERGGLSWSEDMGMVFVGIKEQEEEPPGGNRGNKVPDVDVWHWQDDYIQSVQMIRANRDRNFTWSASVDLGRSRLVRLTDEEMRDVSLTRDGRWGIGRDDRAYLSDWEESRSDYYRVDTRTGERIPMLTAHGRTLGFSPDSRWFLYWKDEHIWAYALADNRHLNLTEQAPVSFVNLEFDNPSAPSPYGVAGWSKDGRSVLLNHRYDIWRQPLDGRPAENLTGGTGDREEIRFRIVRLDPEERFIDLGAPLLLSAYGQWTKQAGFYRLHRGRLQSLVFEDRNFGTPRKARDADRVMYTRESFREFPDYYVSDLTFASPQRITEAVPWQQEYRWGHTILIDYTNRDGVRLQGALAIPDDYRPGEQRPMLVSYYEKNSQNLHRYPRPVYRGSPMHAHYLSKGYLVLLPDIHFRTRTTHSDMLECVEAAVQRVIDLGYVDPARVGVHGHSFSGQGSAYFSTHSDMFAAICYGAGATNLVSDFNQLWKSAGTNNHRYNIYGQGRFGTNPFDDLELYIEQSAVYRAREMNTPLLIMHGTEDGSVEWLQAIEFYNALRFNGKNVILLSYPGEGHGLARLENQIDFQSRMEQFFDHHLMGQPAPDWMVEGVPFLQKPPR